MTNVYRQLLDLLPEAPLLAGEVIVNHSDGTVTVELLGGGQLRARGVAASGDRVFVRDGVVEGPAPDLTAVVIEV